MSDVGVSCHAAAAAAAVAADDDDSGGGGAADEDAWRRSTERWQLCQHKSLSASSGCRLHFCLSVISSRRSGSA